MAIATTTHLAYGEVADDTLRHSSRVLHNFELVINNGSITQLVHRVPDNLLKKANDQGLNRGIVQETYFFNGKLESARPSYIRSRPKSTINDEPTFMFDLLKVANDMIDDIDKLVEAGMLKNDQSQVIREAIRQVTSGEFGPVTIDLESNGKDLDKVSIVPVSIRSRNGIPRDERKLCPIVSMNSTGIEIDLLQV